MHCNIIFTACFEKCSNKHYLRILQEDSGRNLYSYKILCLKAKNVLYCQIHTQLISCWRECPSGFTREYSQDWLSGLQIIEHSNFSKSLDSYLSSVSGKFQVFTFLKSRALLRLCLDLVGLQRVSLPGFHFLNQHIRS